LCGVAGKGDEGVGVGVHAGDGADHIAGRLVREGMNRRDRMDVLVEDVEFLGGGVLFEELAGDFAFGG
jgi:hypothetical protein